MLFRRRKKVSMENEHGYCPKCNLNLDGENIWDYFNKIKASEEDADKAAALYGATREKGCFGKEIGIYSYDEDRTVAYRCPECNHEWKRT